MGKYDFPLEMDVDDTNPKIIKRVGDASEVLEFGAANGRMTKYLARQKNCLVDIVELDEQSGRQAKEFAREACLGTEEGNIENYIWVEKYCQNKYDFIIFADVLEHLSDPERVLSECKNILKENGRIIVSIPNMANNAIIYQLLNDEFEYRDTGLLDRTHIHFFTMNSFRKMAAELGYYITDEDAVCRQADETEFDILLGDMDNVYRRALGRHREGLIYQGIFVLSLRGEKNAPLFSGDKFENNLLAVKLYFQRIAEGDFSERDSIVKRAEIHGQKIVFDIKCDVDAIRIDPMNDMGIIRLKRLEVYAEDDKKIDIEYVTNGRRLQDNLYVFGVKTPQILMKDIGQYVSKLVLDYDIVTYAAEGMEYIAKAAEERETALYNYQNACRELNEIKSSMWGKIFWKLKRWKSILRKN